MMRSFRRYFSILAVFATVAVVLASCETSRYRHDPPPGQGGLVVDNSSGDRLYVFLDGHRTNNVSRWHYEIFDVDPGVYRLVIDQRDGYRTWRGDVDVMEGRLTVVLLTIDYTSHEYGARLYFD